MNVKDEFICKFCREIIKNPVTLNCCSDKICKQHIEELFANNSSTRFMCPFCNEENLNQKLNVDKFMQKMLENDLHNFEIDSRHRKILEVLKTEIKTLETIFQDSENVIYEEINELKRQVDLDREELKSRIDTSADDLIQQLETYKKKFNTEYKSNVDFKGCSALVELARKQLAEYEKCLNFFSTKNQERDEKSSQSEDVISQLECKIKDEKFKLFSSQRLQYKPMVNRIKDIFGKLTITVS